MPAFATETRRLKESLPAEVRRTLDEHEAAGTTDDEAYGEAAMAYFTRWICHLDLPWPDRVTRSVDSIGEDVYATIQGPEWNVTGNLKGWDVTARLAELALPALVTSGRYDEMSEAVVSPLVAGIRGAVGGVRGQRPLRAGRGAGPLPRRRNHLPRPRRGDT